MSIKIEFSKGSFRSEAVLRDAALSDLIQLIEKHQTEGASPPSSGAPPKFTAQNEHAASCEDVVSKSKAWLSKHTASEVLRQFDVLDTNPEKILLLGAFHESNGGQEGWKSADITARFEQAREPLPANLSRDLSQAVEEGFIGTVTPRSYRVGRKGWEEIADAIDDAKAIDGIKEK